MTPREIKENYTIRDILDNHGIKYRGNRCKAVCHDSDRESAIFDKTRYTCFVCNKHLDVISLEMELSHTDFKTACRYISGEDLTKEDAYKLEIARQVRAQKEKEKKQLLCEQRKALDQVAHSNTVIRAMESIKPEDMTENNWKLLFRAINVGQKYGLLSDELEAKITALK